ncbi:MAG: hypothetical protein LOY03_03840 [Cyclobacteriaceae bacterium]|nr:hypothetical protein [Cyclobacteriaceae bacterium]
MRSPKIFLKVALFSVGVFSATSCHDLLDEGPENRTFAGETDYTNTNNMILPLIGAYAEFQSRGWEDFPLISVRGDDVNAGGLGDQQPFWDTDEYVYTQDYWMYNSVWQNLYVYGRYHGLARQDASRRGQELLHFMQLEAKRDARPRIVQTVRAQSGTCRSVHRRSPYASRVPAVPADPRLG